MIVEERTYIVQPGKAGQFLKHVETLGLPVSKPTLGGLIGYFHTEIGGLNQIVHLWAYASLDDRARRRRKLAANPDWQKFLDAALPLIERMENRVLIPAPFNPLTAADVAAMNARAPDQRAMTSSSASRKGRKSR